MSVAAQLYSFQLYQLGCGKGSDTCNDYTLSLHTVASGWAMMIALWQWLLWDFNLTCQSLKVATVIEIIAYKLSHTHMLGVCSYKQASMCISHILISQSTNI